MAGHKAWNRFNNSRAYWNQNGQAIKREKEHYFSILPKPVGVSPIRQDALEAARKYTQDVRINKIAIKWSK
ncbi:MAG: hypothetical protein FD189_1301 [Elusimicrobia bacterium]|nr:MAG: hypothetical protein FD154_1525 [Elusimicrobiota bacterium]KAF0155708.1 MAG: hypothetical protein FD189_1301 [Elusimicrobiota bacterium]